MIEKIKQNIIELETRTWQLQQNLARPAAPSWDLWRTPKPAKRLLPQNHLTRPPVKTVPFPSLKPPSNPSGETTNRLNMCFSQVSYNLLSILSIRFCKIKGSKKFLAINIQEGFNLKINCPWLIRLTKYYECLHCLGCYKPWAVKNNLKQVLHNQTLFILNL